jgi:hypothetical protein
MYNKYLPIKDMQIHSNHAKFTPKSSNSSTQTFSFIQLANFPECGEFKYRKIGHVDSDFMLVVIGFLDLQLLKGHYFSHGLTHSETSKMH